MMILPNLPINQQIKSQLPALQIQTWSNIPQVSILTGLNGSGKTKLLNAITQHLSTQRKQANRDFFYIPCNHNPDSLLQASDVNKYTQEEARILQTLKGWKNQWKNNPQSRIQFQQNNQSNADYEILEYIEKQHNKKITEFSDTDVNEIVPDIPFEQIQRNINNIKISEIFIKFCKIKERIELKLCYEEITKEEKESKVREKLKKAGYEKAPWDLINQKLKDNQFQHTISKPINSNNYTPKFVTESGQEIDFTQLSSGEKVIVQLILWSYDSASSAKTGNYNKLFIMDEFDAHLNPSMAEMFIKIVKEVLVGQFQMQVILTTHSPSTIAYCEEESVFWMEEGKILQGDEKKSKQEVIKNLATGLILLEDSVDTISLLAQSTKDKILFVEGKSDKIYLEKAMKVLKDINLEEIDIIPCCGASTMNTIISFFKELPSYSSDKQLILLVDNDSAGRGVTIKNDNNTNIQKIVIPILDVHKCDGIDNNKIQYPIEFLFGFDLLNDNNLLEEQKTTNHINSNGLTELSTIIQTLTQDDNKKILCYYLKEGSQNKTTFANKLEETKENFQNFKPLLDEIQKVFGIKK